MKFLFLFTLCLASFSSWAKNQELVKITNDADSSIATITITERDGSIQSMTIREVENKNARTATFNQSDLKNGAVVKKMAGKNIMIAKVSSNFDSRYGGEVVFNYLENGIRNIRKNVSYDLLKNGERWELSANKRIVKKLHVVTKRILGQPVGIEKLENK